MIKGTVHKPAIAINQDARKGCKACMQIGCPAISFKDKKGILTQHYVSDEGASRCADSMQ